VRKKIVLMGQLEQQPRQNKNLLLWHDKTNEPTKLDPFSFVLFESPFTSVSTVSRVHHLYNLSDADTKKNIILVRKGVSNVLISCVKKYKV
jgi:hypothetical protein